MSTTSYLIDGIDRLGKSTLIESIQQSLGYYQISHLTKPQVLNAYKELVNPLEKYQRSTFITMFKILMASQTFNFKIIYDRTHLGEYIYSPMYRGFSGEYVFDLEKSMGLDKLYSTKLILLVEDFSISKHFVDDGLSLGLVEQREEEQEKFIEAFHLSCIRNKKIICVTARDGHFRSKEDILLEALL